MLRDRLRLLDLDRAPDFSSGAEGDVVVSAIAYRDYSPETRDEEAILEDAEQTELVNAVTLFVENYRLMHAGTLYSLRVEEAARRVRAKLREL